LGDLLSAFNLSGDKRWLEKAVDIRNMLYASFNTPNRLPVTRWKPMEAAAEKKQVVDETAVG